VWPGAVEGSDHGHWWPASLAPALLYLSRQVETLPGFLKLGLNLKTRQVSREASKDKALYRTSSEKLLKALSCAWKHLTTVYCACALPFNASSPLRCRSNKWWRRRSPGNTAIVCVNSIEANLRYMYFLLSKHKKQCMSLKSPPRDGRPGTGDNLYNLRFSTLQTWFSIPNTWFKL